jgi:hypothetical protein
MKGKVSVLACSAAAALCVNAEFKKPAEAKLVPGLMVTAAGEQVDGVEKWEKIRRGEILRTFREEFYGVRPVERPADLKFTEIAPVEECFGGKALRKRVKGTYSGPGGSSEFVFSVWIPKCDRPVAVFVHSSPRPAETAADVNGPRPVYWLPAEDIVSRGYAVVAYCNQEIALDWHMTDVATNGVFKVFGNAKLKERRPTEWGILSAWAWGMSRIVDWIETEPLLDPKRIAGVGLSRNGKTSLVAGATDDRFAMVVSCCSGCGGAKLNHMVCDQSETIGDLARAVNWFAPNFLKYVGKDRGAEMKFDQHLLLALVAPRLLYVSSAVEDAWAGPRGEFAAAALASPAWELYGKAGLVHHGFPKADYPLHAGNIGYHLRTGLHDITRIDWHLYMDFADGHGWNLPR